MAVVVDKVLCQGWWSAHWLSLHRFHSAILQRNVKNSDELGNPLSLQLLALVRAQWMRSMMPLRRPVARGAV